MLNYHRTIKISSVLIASITFLSACATTDGTEDIDDTYMRSGKGPELQLPAQDGELKVSDDYRVPEGQVITNRQPQGKQLNLEPPQLLLIAGDGVREVSDSEQPTVWIRSDKQQLISYIKRFMDSQNITFDQPDEVTVATSWISDDDESAVSKRIGAYYVEGQRHKFSFSIIESNPNEVALQSKHLSNQQRQNDEWVNVETSDRVAKQFLNYFVGYYDSERTREARARILQEAKIDVELGYSDQGSLALITEREFLAVWDQLPRVLEALNLSITDRDRSEKTYYFTVPEDDDGFWSWIGEDESSKVELEPGNYQMKLQELSAGGISMSFYDAEGVMLDSSIVTRIYPEFAAEFKRGKE